MTTLSHTMTDPLGLHASLVSKLLNFAKTHKIDLHLSFHDREVSVNDFGACMALDVREGDNLTIQTESELETEVLGELTALIESF